ncbi:MAG: YecA family protein, partial [Mesorhizobium sp.]
MSAIDDMALSDEALEAWMAVENSRPLMHHVGAGWLRNSSGNGPQFPDRQYWMCAVMGLPRDVLAKGSATD